MKDIGEYKEVNIDQPGFRQWFHELADGVKLSIIWSASAVRGGEHVSISRWRDGAAGARERASDEDCQAALAALFPALTFTEKNLIASDVRHFWSALWSQPWRPATFRPEPSSSRPCLEKA